MARAGAGRGADAGVPPRGARLRGDVARLPGARGRGHRAAARSSTAAPGYGGSDPVAAAPPAHVHARRGARRSCPRCSTRRASRARVLVGHSDGGVDRARLRGQRPAAGARACAALVLEAPHVFVEDVSRREHRRGAARPTSTATCASASRGTTATTSTARSGAGTAPGSTRASAPGTSRTFLPRIAVPVLVIQGEDDAYGTLAQVDAIERGAGAPGARASCSPAAATPPTATPPTPSSPRSPRFTAALRSVEGTARTQPEDAVAAGVQSFLSIFPAPAPCFDRCFTLTACTSLPLLYRAAP